MSMKLQSIVTTLAGQSFEVLDLTSPLDAQTPIIQLPPEINPTPGFQSTNISNFDEGGPDTYWNSFETGEHVGTHIDAPNHWISGRDRIDVSQIPLDHLIAPALVIDRTSEVTKDGTDVLTLAILQDFLGQHAPIRQGTWLLYRTGWSQYFLPGATEPEVSTPGMDDEAARWLAQESPIVGFGVETVGTDSTGAWEYAQPFPTHYYMHGAGKYGVTLLRNLDKLPASGAHLVIAPLPIIGGSGSPARVLALIPRS